MLHQDDKKLRLGCLIMAAGRSERFGKNKLLEKADGKEIILRVIDTVLCAQKMLMTDSTDLMLEPLLVTRYRQIEELCRVKKVPCLMYQGGLLSDTVRCGLKYPGASDWDACLFAAGDQPYLTAHTLCRLIKAWEEEPSSVCRLSADNKPGNPIIFPKIYFDRLRELEGDRGGREILKQGNIPVKYVVASDARELYDIDTPDDLT